MNEQVITCPCCGREVAGPERIRYSVEEAATYFCPPSRDSGRHLLLKEAIGELWPEGYVRILECTACGFGFAVPHLGGSSAFYDALHEQAGYPGDRWDYGIALGTSAFDVAQGKVLDIGAGSGAFLDKVPQAWEKFAVESSVVIREQLKADGIKVYSSIDMIPDDQKFRLITFFQVLEHLAPFEPVLKATVSKLEPDGWLVISVPDGRMMSEQERRLGSPDMPPNHVNRWTPESLASVLSDLGLEASSPVFEPSHPSLILKRLHLVLLQRAAKAPYSLSSLVYRIKKRSYRIILLAVLAVGEALRHFRKLRWMVKGGSFVIIAKRKMTPAKHWIS